MSRRTLPADGRFEWVVPPVFNIAESCCASWARTEPERTALIDVGDTEKVWTYGDLDAAAARLAGALARRGIGPGDRIALLLGQGAEVLIGHFAAHRLGAISLPLFTPFGPEALRVRLADSGAALAITDESGAAKLAGLRDALPHLREVIRIDTDAWAEMISAGSPDFPVTGTAADDPAMLIYTSGTTGPPKGVLHAHRFLLGHLPCLEVNHPGLPQPDDVGWTPADWAWIGGLMDLALPCLHYGIPLVAHRMRKFDAGAAWDLIARHGVTRLFLPPAALRHMRRVPVPAGVRVRSIGSGGEALEPALSDWARDVLGAELYELYGQTECNLVIASGPGAVRAGTMGRAVPGHEVAVLNDAGDPARGAVGEIAVRRPDPAMFLRYWRRPEATEDKFHGDWMRTGDLGEMDEDGFVRFVSRDDDVINSSGYRIGPTEIEACLLRDARVAAAAVVGLPDAERGQAITAFVVATTPDQGFAQTLIDRVRRELSPHMAPREVRFLDALPMTATGKVMRRALRDA